MNWLQQVWEDTNIFGGTILKILLTWGSVVIALKMSYGEHGIFLWHTLQPYTEIIHCGPNNLDRSQPEDIAVGVMKIPAIFMKNHPKITTIITGMIPRNKTHSFRQAKIDKTNGILKVKCKNRSIFYGSGWRLGEKWFDIRWKLIMQRFCLPSGDW